MVVTPLMWKSLDNFTTYFAYLWPCPLSWDKKYKKYTYTPFCKKLNPWILAIAFCLVGRLFLASIVLGQIYGWVSMPLVPSLTNIYYLVISQFMLIEASTLFYGEQFATGFNFLNGDGGWDYKNGWVVFSTFLPNIYTNPKEGQPSAKFDLLGNVLNHMVRNCATFSFTTGFFSLYVDLDPGYICIKYLPSRLSQLVDVYPWNYVLLPHRILFAMVATVEINRIAAHVFCSFTVAFHLIFSSITALTRSPLTLNMSRVQKTLTQYTQLNLIMTLLYDSFATTIAVMMSTIWICCVLLNFATIKMYSYISMPFFALIPVSAIAAHLGVGVLMPILVEVYEGSQPIRARWELQLATFSKVGEVKWLTKRATPRGILSQRVRWVGITFTTHATKSINNSGQPLEVDPSTVFQIEAHKP
ncbi:hypothetical protein Fcan01_08767 [Folsomia candida]|uniref:Uncharacterized protein n=1 Tax=Folsomia candida TaxID=158441 RepID=A0A226EDT5_FOLCA|nr:hypothetical protein Fcan01_08767 [Folsomia candida]